MALPQGAFHLLCHLGQNFPPSCDDGLGKRRWSLAYLVQELNENTEPVLFYMYLVK